MLESDQRQATLSATGEVDLLPGQTYGGGGTTGTVVEASVSAQISGYHPAPGVTLSGQISWSTSGPLEIAGRLVATARGTDITTDVNGSYTDANNWTLYASLAAPSGFRVGNLFTLEGLDGRVSRGGDGISFDLSGAVRDVTGIPGVTVSNAKASLSTSGCDFARALAAAVRARTSANDPAKSVCLSVAADLGLTVPGSDKPLHVRGRLVVDLATLELSLSGGVPASQSFGPKELQLHSVHVWATTAPAGAGTCDQLALASRVATATAGLSYGFSAKGTIAGIDVNNIAGAYLADGQSCLGASLGAANLPGKDGGVLQPVGAGAPAGCAAPDAPALQNLTALYSSATGTAKLNGTFCLPGSLRKSLGKLGDGTGTISLRVTRSDSGASLDGDVRYALAQPYW